MIEVDLMRMEEIKSAFQNVFSEVLPAVFIWKQTKIQQNLMKTI